MLVQHRFSPFRSSRNCCWLDQVLPIAWSIFSIAELPWVLQPHWSFGEVFHRGNPAIRTQKGKSVMVLESRLWAIVGRRIRSSGRAGRMPTRVSMTKDNNTAWCEKIDCLVFVMIDWVSSFAVAVDDSSQRRQKGVVERIQDAIAFQSLLQKII